MATYIEWNATEYNSLADDAAKYRYLRDSKHYGGSEKHRLTWYLPRRFDGADLGTQLDECIDSSLHKEKEDA